jgi:hypothetical protein
MEIRSASRSCSGNAGVNMTGMADVRMGDVPWMKFAYELGRKRARY